MKKILIWLILTLPAFATNYYVRTDGSNTNTGTVNSSGGAWLTIARANTTVVAGDVVHVQSGTYTSAMISTTVSGTSGNPITYVSDTKWAAKIVINTVGDRCWTNSGNFVTINGFDVTELAPGSCRLAMYSTGGNTRFINNRVHDIYRDAAITGCTSSGASMIQVDGTGLNSEVSGNLVFNQGDTSVHTCNKIQGLYISQASATVTNNLVFNVLSFGLQNSHHVGNSIIANNTLINNAYGGMYLGNNDDASPNSNNRIHNNIVYNNNTRGIEYDFSTYTSNTTMQNNLVFGQTTDWQGGSNSTAHTGDVSSNPLFVNYTGDINGDYHLQSSSPARDAGTSSNAPATDFDGVTRPQGSFYDIGAYEYVIGGGGGSSCTSAPLFVQQSIASTAAATSLPVTINAPAAGGTLVGFYSGNQALNATTGFAGGGVTWVRAANTCVNSCTEIWYGVNSSGSGTTVTVTPTASAGMSVNVSEFSGIATLSPLDATATATNNASATTHSTNSLTPSIGGDLILALASVVDATSGSLSSGPTNGFAGLTATATARRGLPAYLVQSSAAAISTSWTWSALISWDTLAISLKAAGGVCKVPRQASAITMQ